MSDALDFIGFILLIILPLAVSTGLVLLVSAVIFWKREDRYRRILAPPVSHVVGVIGGGIGMGISMSFIPHAEYDGFISDISFLLWSIVFHLIALAGAIFPAELLWRKHRPRWFDLSPIVAAVAWVLTILAVNAVELSFVALILDSSANPVYLIIFWSPALAISLIVYRLISTRLPSMAEEHEGTSVS